MRSSRVALCQLELLFSCGFAERSMDTGSSSPCLCGSCFINFKQSRPWTSHPHECCSFHPDDIIRRSLWCTTGANVGLRNWTVPRMRSCMRERGRVMRLHNVVSSCCVYVEGTGLRGCVEEESRWSGVGFAVLFLNLLHSYEGRRLNIRTVVRDIGWRCK